MACRFLATLVIAVAGTPAFALEMAKTIHVDVEPSLVWAKISPSCSVVDWYPGVETCSLSEQRGNLIRTYRWRNGNIAAERLLEKSELSRSFSYEVLETALPVARMTYHVQIFGDGAGSKISWTSEFESKDVSDSEARIAVGGNFDAALFNLAVKLR